MDFFHQPASTSGVSPHSHAQPSNDDTTTLTPVTVDALSSSSSSSPALNFNSEDQDFLQRSLIVTLPSWPPSSLSLNQKTSARRPTNASGQPDSFLPQAVDDRSPVHYPANISTTSGNDRRRSIQHPIRTTPDQSNGPVPTTEPWNSVTLRGQPVADFRVPNPVNKRTPSRAQTDSGYETLTSDRFMSHNTGMANVTGNLMYAPGESRESTMHQVLPDQQLPNAASPDMDTTRHQSVASMQNLESVDSWQCGPCSQTFTTSSEHTKHMARHERRYRCQVEGCLRKEGFATLNDLERHNKGVHSKIGVEDNVWKCFVPGCKVPDKIWPRQDNFRQHLKRMHENCDVEDYVRQSEDWCEQEDKPRRRMEQKLLSQLDTDMLAFSPIDGEPSIIPYAHAFAMTSTYAPSQVSRVGGSEYPGTVDEDIAASSNPNLWPSPSTGRPPYPTPSSHSVHLPALDPTTTDMTRSFSENPPAIWAHGAPLDIPGDGTVTQPFSHRDSRWMESLRAPHNFMLPDGVQSVPDLERDFDESEWMTQASAQHARPSASFVTDMSSTTDNPLLLGLGLEMQDQASNIQQFPPAMDFAGADTTVAPDTDARSSSQDFRSDVADFAQKIAARIDDPAFIHQLQSTILKVLQERSFSSLGAKGHPGTSCELKLYPCSRAGCSKSFARRNRLTKHEKRHDRPYFCTFDDCPKVFGTKTDMMRHEKATSHHQQPQAWRCWSNTRSRDKNKQCAQAFHTESAFLAHRRDKHSPCKSTELFKIDKDFAGQFWCGFCNQVQPNPVPGGVDGTARIKYRYGHIEDHINERLRKNPGQRTSAGWYQLHGNGSTKQDERREGKLRMGGDEYDDDDDTLSDEEDSDGPIRSLPSSAPTNSQRPRALSALTSAEQHLAVPAAGLHRPRPFKRPAAPKGFPQEPNKMRRLNSTQSVVDARRNIPGTTLRFGPPQRAGHSITQPSSDTTIYVKCCRCPNSGLRALGGTGARTCVGCWQPPCGSCSYFSASGSPMTLKFSSNASDPSSASASYQGHGPAPMDRQQTR